MIEKAFGMKLPRELEMEFIKGMPVESLMTKLNYLMKEKIIMKNTIKLKSADHSHDGDN